MWIPKKKLINFHFIMKGSLSQFEIKVKDQDKMHQEAAQLKVNSIIS
jgi:hypothetical protein